MKINGEEVVPKRIHMNEGMWNLHCEEKGKLRIIPFASIETADALPIDEILIIRPLTTHLIADPLTRTVLKIFVDTRDIVTNMCTEVREEKNAE